ncbi:class I SAM-dependent methyltransferase [Lysobacter sp. K5869]|uniref:class I SAM-dependent methyltransferase n=1 Tax=Lysobacter sp. K5869 TaxID=2820808 RepID=UPI001C06472A|nr:class I SAM-dependent methyltransferase [Lysobacter sp. K5869]QWP77120.1 class I SAM-dependent methyltransferase [Lysobacter sp. K5869]
MERISTSMLLAAACVRQARRDADPAVQRSAVLAHACLQRCGAPGRRLLFAVDRAPGRWLLALLEALYLPGLGAHYAWRKRHIRRWALQACDGGAEQVVLLGAGFDGLSLALLARAPHLRVIEIERERTVAIKRAALREIGADDAQLILVAADLSARPIAAVLRASPGFDPQRPTLIVAEGVLMYLGVDQLRVLLQGLADTLPGARLIATAMDVDAAGTPGFARQRPWVGRWLRRAGEPFRWGAARDALGAAMSDAGARLDRLADPDAVDDPDPSPGEWVFAGSLQRPASDAEPVASDAGDNPPALRTAASAAACGR